MSERAKTLANAAGFARKGFWTDARHRFVCSIIGHKYGGRYPSESLILCDRCAWCKLRPGP